MIFSRCLYVAQSYRPEIKRESNIRKAKTYLHKLLLEGNVIASPVRKNVAVLARLQEVVATQPLAAIAIVTYSCQIWTVAVRRI